MRASLSHRVALYLALLAALLIGIGLAVVGALAYRTSDELGRSLIESFDDARTLDATQALRRSGRYLGKRLFNPLYELDVSRLNAEIAQIRDWLPVTDFLILDAEQRVVTDGSTENARYGQVVELPAGLSAQHPVTRERPEQTTLYLTISFNEATIGYAVVDLSKAATQRSLAMLRARGEAIWARTSDYLLVGGVLAFAAVSAVAFLLSWWLSRAMSRPLREMTEAARAFAAGDLDLVLQVRSDDEVGELARSLNQMAADLKKSGSLLAKSQEMANLGSWEWRHDEDRLRLSAGADRVLGIETGGAPTTLGRILTLLDDDDREPAATVFTGHPITRSHSEVRIRRPDGSARVLQIVGEPTNDPAGAGFVGTLQDVTERRENENALVRLANYDTLTGLPNRNLMREHLDQAMRRAEHNGTQVALLFLDLDRFKSINDSLGHTAGDELLKGVAARLSAIAGDAVCIARLGGDELTLILEGNDADDQAAELSERVLEALARPFRISGRALVVSASIGITLYPRDADDIHSLLRTADTAMYLAKEQGRNTYRFFTTELDRLAHARLSLEHDLRRAIARGELELHFQPQIRIDALRLVGAEALLRWQTPSGPVAPERFIALLEDTGLINELTPRIIDDACDFARACREHGLGDLRVSVNLCARELQHPALAQRIDSALRRTGLWPRLLEVEITESALLDAESSLVSVDSLTTLGVRLALDDFGTGYSSLAYLKRYAVDCLKVDRSFVRDIEDDPDDALITAAVIALAKRLGIEVVAEGVETDAQLLALRELGCDLAQGYLFAPAMSGKRFLDWADAWGVRVADALEQSTDANQPRSA